MTDLDKLEAATKLRRILNAHPNTNVYDLPEMAGYAMGYTEQALVHLCVELMEKDHLAALTNSVPMDVMCEVREHISASLGAITWEDPKAAETWLKEALRLLQPFCKEG